MFELRLLCPEANVEMVSEALEALDALSVSVEDADAQTASEQPLFGEPGMPAPREGWQRSLLTALFMTQEAAEEAARLLAVQDYFAGSSVTGVQPLPDQDWVRLTQAQFAPVAITPDFWIVPSWHEAPAQARQLIRLDPGLAFGTGTHPTTRMCLRWLAQSPDVPVRGCLITAAAPAFWLLARPNTALHRWMRWISTQQPSPRRATMPPTMRQACAVACPTWSNLPRPGTGSFWPTFWRRL